MIWKNLILCGFTQITALLVICVLRKKVFKISLKKCGPRHTKGSLFEQIRVYTTCECFHTSYTLSDQLTLKRRFYKIILYIFIKKKIIIPIVAQLYPSGSWIEQTRIYTIHASFSFLKGEEDFQKITDFQSILIISPWKQY